jgi:MGT family glycosyltransferase
MKQRHIAVFTPLMGGHIYPALGVCSELVRRGHHVTYPTTESHAARIRQAGVTPIEFVAPQLRHVEKISEDSEPDGPKYWRAFISVVGPLMIATAAVTVAELKSYYASNPPDLIIYDWFAFAGRILAKQLGRPAIQLHSHFAHHDSLMRVDGVCTTPEPLLGYARLLDSFMSTYGFEERCLWHYEKLNLFLIPRSFQYDRETFDSRFQFVGPTHNRQPGSGTWKSSAGTGKPLLLISETTASTNGNFLRLCIDAFAESKYHVVVSKAPNSPEAASLPSNFEINRTVFNREILPFASVMVCQGGMGTTLESLYHGVPVVSLPPDMFNSEVAYRADELGLGVHIRQRDLTPGRLREAVDRAFSDESMRQRVERMQSDLTTSPGPVGAADSVEDFIASL